MLPRIAQRTPRLTRDVRTVAIILSYLLYLVDIRQLAVMKSKRLIPDERLLNGIEFYTYVSM